MKQPFFICWQPDKPNSYPTVQHATPDEAEKEAVRIATKEGKPVHVMELRGTVRVECNAVWEYPDTEQTDCSELANVCPLCFQKRSILSNGEIICGCEPAKVDTARCIFCYYNNRVCTCYKNNP